MMWFVIDFAPDEPVPLYQIVPKKNKNKKHISSYDGLHVLNNHITILPNNPAGLWGVVLGQILAVIQIIHFHHKVISVQSVSWKTLALHRLVYKNEEKKQTNKQTNSQTGTLGSHFFPRVQLKPHSLCSSLP